MEANDNDPFSDYNANLLKLRRLSWALVHDGISESPDGHGDYFEQLRHSIEITDHN